MQLALYQRFYCRVARGWARAVKVVDLEHQLGLMVPTVHLSNLEHTVSMGNNMANMVKRPLMLVDLMPLVPAGHMVLPQDLDKVALDRAASVKPALDRQDLELAVLVSDQAALVKQDLGQAALDLDKADLDQVVLDLDRLALANLDLELAVLDLDRLALVKPDLARQALELAVLVSDQAASAKPELDRLALANLDLELATLDLDKQDLDRALLLAQA